MNKRQYFASSNSMMGFQSYFKDIYDPLKLKKIYIIKGGPGTGKSSLMKAVGEAFEKDCGCEYFLCSSDPRSLDGIIIGNDIAVLDGTSPHTVDARYPKAVETLIDNAIGISDDIAERKKAIIELSSEKNKLYKYAYTYLKAAGEIKSEHLQKLFNITDQNKLDAAIGRYFRQCFKEGKSYSETIRLTEGITPLGIYKTEGFESSSVNQAVIINARGYEAIVFNAILKKAKEYKLKTTLSYDPLIPFSPNGIMFEDLAACSVKYDNRIHRELNYDEYKVINFERFIDKTSLNELKPKLKFAEKCTESLINEATAALSRASLIHKELEKIYCIYTDYSKIDANIHRVINGISDFFANTSIVHNNP